MDVMNMNTMTSRNHHISRSFTTVCRLFTYWEWLDCDNNSALNYPILLNFHKQVQDEKDWRNGQSQVAMRR